MRLEVPVYEKVYGFFERPILKGLLIHNDEGIIYLIILAFVN